MKKSTISPSRIGSDIMLFLKDRFNLSEDEATQKEVIADIEKGVVFRGANLWILMFAIMVASVGLNVNSTAVIIGAMLISPLMGPIMGIGLGIGINDFELIVKALKNLGIAVGISVITSALYFWISPLNDAQSELLARTSPTLWDVLIALFGGLAGIVASSRKEKSNAIPGVAIATALMPPLCTAGYGLATGQWNYFFGAFYLFFINSVFISFSTYLIVRALRYSKKEFLDHKREKRVRRYIAIFVLLTIIPSLYTAYNVVNESLFKRQANQFISQEINFENCQIIYRKLTYDRKSSTIEITLFGEPVSQEKINEAATKLSKYGLKNTHLAVRQGYIGEEKGVDMAEVEKLNQQIRTGIIEDIYKRNEAMLQSKDAQIKVLEDEIFQMRSKELPMPEIVNEIKAINSNVKELSITLSVLSEVDSLKFDTLYLAYASFKKRPSRNEIKQLDTWLKARAKSDKLKLVTN